MNHLINSPVMERKRDLRDRINLDRARIKGLTQEIESLRDDLAKARGSEDQWRKVANQARDKVAKSDKGLVITTDELEQRKDDHRKAIKASDACERRAQDAEAKAAAAKERADDHQATAASLRDQLSDMQAENRARAAALVALRAELAAALQDNGDHLQHIEDLEADNSMLRHNTTEVEDDAPEPDPIYQLVRAASQPLSQKKISDRLGRKVSWQELANHPRLKSVGRKPKKYQPK